ncbi:unnamed protein product [Coregonus sp. 'balchen']|nr:unnamed protein product [Coregonus sp. 'balchen']
MCDTGVTSDVMMTQRRGSWVEKEGERSKQNAPYWRLSLVNVCRMVNSLINSRLWREQEEYNTGEELGERLASLPEPLDELLDLQHICRILQPRERQVKNTKARRPYILKRRSFY